MAVFNRGGWVDPKCVRTFGLNQGLRAADSRPHSCGDKEFVLLLILITSAISLYFISLLPPSFDIRLPVNSLSLVHCDTNTDIKYLSARLPSTKTPDRRSRR
ncbi:Clock-controlled protein 6 [Fusarium oxysporum f. sp. albedinis]|nr:Clock-controlled protein 6 [Fusarium oxysporum f. sp. albedinis]